MHIAGRPRRARHRVDTHKDTHTAAVVTAATGAVLEQVIVSATPAGYQRLLRLAGRHQGQRLWAIEGTGGDGAGLTRFLAAHAKQWWSWTDPSGPAAATAPGPTRWMPPGRPVRPWAVTSLPSPRPPASAQRCRCG
jgi:hypothetical protein